MTRNVLSFTIGILLASVAAGSASAQFIEKKTINLATAKKLAAAAETEARLLLQLDLLHAGMDVRFLVAVPVFLQPVPARRQRKRDRRWTERR